MRDKYILGSLTSKTKREFGNRERIQGKKDFGQIHIYEVSLRGRRETSEKFIRGRRECSRAERDFENILIINLQNQVLVIKLKYYENTT
jgi:hypothetical protein